MPERPLASILDRLRKKSVKLEAAEKAKPARAELQLTPEEDIRLKGYLVKAKELEQSGNQSAALKLYALYKQEFLIVKNKGKETSATSPEFAEALAEVFKGEELDRVAMPKPEELTDEYFAKMYPATQRETDTARGLVSYRSNWWNQSANKDVVGPAEETWGQAYERSMRAEAERFAEDSIIITESIQKPKYKDGSQQYGTKEGDDAGTDPLLPLIKEVFGENANRFNLSWDDITEKLLPKVKEKIQDEFAGKHLSVQNFEVILTPAIISNRQMTDLRPENSQTNTSEWTSTIMLKQDGTDSGNRLVVGSSENGGAGCVNYDHRGSRWDGRGFRLSVVSDK